MTLGSAISEDGSVIPLQGRSTTTGDKHCPPVAQEVYFGPLQRLQGQLLQVPLTAEVAERTCAAMASSVHRSVYHCALLVPNVTAQETPTTVYLHWCDISETGMCETGHCKFGAQLFR